MEGNTPQEPGSAPVVDNDDANQLEAGSESNDGEQGTPPGDGDNALTEGAQQAINKQTRRFRDEERRANDLAAENQRLKGLLPQEQRPEIPPIPDQYSDTYAADVEARDKVIQEATDFDTRKKVADQRANDDALDAQNKQQKSYLDAVTVYDGRAKDLGMSEQDLSNAGLTVFQYGIHDDVAMHIIGDDQGPLITAFLAKNPDELDKLNSMTPMQAAVRVSTVLKDKVKAATGITNAPPPPDHLNGGGAPPAERGPEGATYE